MRNRANTGDGAVVGRYIYGAWGEELHSINNVPGGTECRFVGGLGVRTEPVTGLLYMRHRWYDPQLQRFISRDPVGLETGSNLYSYANSNPASLTDSDGLYPKGSAKHCADLENILKNLRKEIIKRIRDLNINKDNQPYDKWCAFHNRT